MSKLWSSDEIQHLQSVYGTEMTRAQIAKSLNRSVVSISDKALELNLKRLHKSLKKWWVQSEITILKKEYEFCNIKELCTRLTRSQRSVQVKANSIGCHRKNFLKAPIHSKLLTDKATGYELGFIIGLIEGEGSLGLTGGFKGMYPILSISNTNRLLLEKAQDIIGGNIACSTSNNIKHKDAYRLFLSGIHTILQTLKKLDGHLITKNQQCKLLIKYCEIRLTKQRGERISLTEHQIYNALKELNKRGKQ